MADPRTAQSSPERIDPGAPNAAESELPGALPTGRESLAAALVGRPRAGKLALYQRVLPWMSLVMGIAGVLTMDRGPRRAAFVGAATVGSWLSLLLVHWLARLRDGDGVRRWRRRALFALRQSSLMATQSAVQLGLFFAIPFYWQASTRDVGHGAFMLALALLSVATLWDPLTEHVLMRPVLGPLLPATASFVALNAALPGLGLSIRDSLWVGSLIPAFGVLALATSNVSSAERKQVAIRTLLPCLLLPLSVLVGVARVIPAAPLRLTRIEFGTEMSGKWVTRPIDRLNAAPAHLFCATAIWSPVGVKDRLFHVWSHDGQARARVELDIRGGRNAGFRTRSRLDLGARAAGNYACQVETATGQVLGRRSIEIGPKAGMPPATANRQ
jgi:Family of unknown function (DUF5924)/Protein of unknown function (DUF2914)